MQELFYIYGETSKRALRVTRQLGYPANSLPAKAVLPLSKEGEFILASRLCVALNLDVYLLFCDKM